MDHKADSPSGRIRAASAQINHSVDVLTVVFAAFAGLALVTWAVTVVVVQSGRQVAPALMLTAVASTLTVVSAVAAVAVANRAYTRRLLDQSLSIVCQQIDEVTRVVAGYCANGRAPVVMDEDVWRGYLARKLDDNTDM